MRFFSEEQNVQTKIVAATLYDPMLTDCETAFQVKTRTDFVQRPEATRY